MKQPGLRNQHFGWGHKKATPREPKASDGKRSPRRLEELSLSELEDKLDEAVSEYVRRMASGPGGLTRCVTCLEPSHWKEMDCGHYVSRVFRATRWNLKNLGVQCPRCNRFLGGVQHVMRAHLVKMYGDEEVRKVELEATMQGETRMDKFWMIEQIRAWRQKLKELRKAGKGE